MHNISNNESHIYIIRGPAGAGKSTISKALCEELKHRNRKVAYIEQDFVRGGILGNYGIKSDYYGPLHET